MRKLIPAQVILQLRFGTPHCSPAKPSSFIELQEIQPLGIPVRAPNRALEGLGPGPKYGSVRELKGPLDSAATGW